MASIGNTANVVRLPTAARRKVQQPMNKAGRAARNTLRAETPWPGEYIFPSVRTAMKQAELIDDLRPSAELELLTAICAALDDVARAKVVEALVPGVVTGRKTAQQALAILRTTRMTVGEANDFDIAWRRLRGREGRR